MFPLPKPRTQEQLLCYPSKTQKKNVNISSYEREDRNIPSLDHSCSDEFLDEIDDQDMIEVGRVTLLSKFQLEMLTPLS